MYKSIVVVFALSALACVALGRLEESEDVKKGAANAFSKGLAAFSGNVANGDTVVPTPGPSASKVYSLYSKGLTAVGGGMPHLVEQYRKHSYVPPGTTKVPVDHKLISDELTPEQTAELTRPRPVYQNVQDHLYIP